MSFRTFGVLLISSAVVAIGACSSSPSDSADGPSDPIEAGGLSASDGSVQADGSSAGDSATSSDAADANDGAAASWRCGHGSFTQAEAVVACAVPNAYLDNGPGAAERACDAATIASGTWEVWCSSGPLLVKLHLENLTGTATHSGCMGSTQRKVVSGWSVLNGGGSGMLSKSSSMLLFDVGKPLSVDLATLGNTQSAKSGTGHLYLIGELPNACGALGQRAVMSGVAISWDAATSG